MSRLGRHVAQIEAQFGADVAAAWRRYHIAAQATRLVSGVAGSVLLAVLHGGVHDWTGLVPVVTGAVWATLASMWPQVPWKLIRGRGRIPATPVPAPPSQES